ncbi:hypothetical protein DPMN_180383 [Dreissena polymorpha]|uniref:Uncharacterized protein n=1 Tax=Dreissena polymorpha TaxID=45954 RepID=A0A9D4EFS1_DREPO|nr:hypothetical protein DPMN_180383 [Dreissena polymorpha]
MVSCSSRYYLYEGFGSQAFNGANVISEVVLRDCSDMPAQECLKIPDPPGANGFTSFTGLSCFSASSRVFNLKIHEYDINETARHMYSTGTVALPSYFAWMYCPIPLLSLLMLLSI